MIDRVHSDDLEATDLVCRLNDFVEKCCQTMEQRIISLEGTCASLLYRVEELERELSIVKSNNLRIGGGE